jgi:acyl transferase domain-containing protein
MTRTSVAIVGIGCRFPGVAGPRAFWDLLLHGEETVREVPPSRWNAEAFHGTDPAVPGKTATRRGGFLDNVEQFDAAFFGISPAEAESMDPQQRLALETCWEALEDAAIVPGTLAGTNAGVLFGVAATDYGRRSYADPARVGVYTNTGASAAIIANRVSYALDLRGPSFIVDTACSSSLVAVHLACRSLRDEEADLILAGGVNVIVGPESTIGFSKLQALSPEGRCRAFDAKANGFVRGEGCGVLVLKRLADAQRDGDRIYAAARP